MSKEGAWKSLAGIITEVQKRLGTISNWLNQSVKTTDGPTFDHIHLGAKQIVTSSKARAFLGTDQLNITSGAWVKVLLDTENYDPGSNFASYKFTAPVSGYYYISAGIRYSGFSAGYSFYIAYGINGEIKAFSSTIPSAVDDLVVGISDCYYLAASNYIELFARTSQPGNVVDVVAGSTTTFLAVHLLSLG